MSLSSTNSVVGAAENTHVSWSPMEKDREWAVLFDLDETLVITHALETLRNTGRWAEVRAGFPKTRLPNGTVTFLEKLSAEVRVGVVTKAPRWYAEQLLAYHALNIPVIVAYRDVRRVKPDPEGLLKAAQSLGVEPSKCIYVGDDANDVKAARAAKCIPVGVCWGNAVDIGLSTICNSWDEVYHEILRLVPG